MEDMKAIFKLNDEKLKFNFRVLTERQRVNESTNSTLKKKKDRVMQAVRDVKLEYEVKQKKFQTINVKLTKDYKSFTNTFKDLQSKFERFEEADDRGIREIWQMNMTEAQELVEKIMHCDEVIHLQ